MSSVLEGHDSLSSDKRLEVETRTNAASRTVFTLTPLRLLVALVELDSDFPRGSRVQTRQL